MDVAGVPRSAAAPASKAIRHRADQEQADVVVLAAHTSPGVVRVTEIARELLDAGTAVLVVPRLHVQRPRFDQIGVGYNGGRPAQAALAVACELVDAGHDCTDHLEIAYVDDSAPESGELDAETVAARRGAVIDWWLAEAAGQVPGVVRPIQITGDPAQQLAERSRHLDLLVIGRRGRRRLRRALTGSVSTSLIATTRCPLLIVPPQVLP
jgi:nucleotide-binding universal stress UspA family protein